MGIRRVVKFDRVEPLVAISHRDGQVQQDVFSSRVLNIRLEKDRSITFYNMELEFPNVTLNIVCLKNRTEHCIYIYDLIWKKNEI